MIIIMKSLKSCENYHNVTLRHKVSICCWKNAICRIAWHRGPTNLPFVEITISVKHNKEKHSKMKYAFIDSHAVVRNIAERSSVPFLISPNGNILQNSSTISQPEYWHWFNPLILFHFLFYFSFVCMCACLFSSMQFCYVFMLLYPPQQWRYIAVSLPQGAFLLSFYNHVCLFPSYSLTTPCQPLICSFL